MAPRPTKICQHLESGRLAEAEGVALNQFINVAMAEKLSALRTENCFRERADLPKARASGG